MDSGLWKKIVLDSNVAAQQEGITALCAFLQYGGVNACLRYMKFFKALILYPKDIKTNCGLFYCYADRGPTQYLHWSKRGFLLLVQEQNRSHLRQFFYI